MRKFKEYDVLIWHTYILQNDYQMIWYTNILQNDYQRVS